MTTIDRRFDHSGMEILGEKTCARILHDQTLGRIGFADENDQPTILPVAYRYRHGRIFFLSSEGSKLRVATDEAPVCFEVDGLDVDTGAGWSVLVRGRCRPLADEDTPLVEELGLRPWLRSVLRPMKWIEIVPEEMTGRRIPGAIVPPEWD